MQGWKSLQSSINAINLAQASSKFTKGFSQSVQATKERLGQVAPEDITELPQGQSVSLNPPTHSSFHLLQSIRISKPASMPSNMPSLPCKSCRFFSSSSPLADDDDDPIGLLVSTNTSPTTIQLRSRKPSPVSPPTSGTISPRSPPRTSKTPISPLPVLLPPLPQLNTKPSPMP